MDHNSLEPKIFKRSLEYSRRDEVDGNKNQQRDLNSMEDSLKWKLLEVTELIFSF